MRKPRGRELGLPFPGQTGPFNAITDVPGVLVGYATLDGRAHDGKFIKTGVTAILPRGYDPQPQPVWAGSHRFNGNGEMTGTHWIEDAGCFFGPLCITNTHNVGMVHHASVRWTVRQYASVGQHLPVGSDAAQELGSIIVILAADAPMLPHQLQRLARRAAIGFGRNGTFGGNGAYAQHHATHSSNLPSYTSSMRCCSAGDSAELVMKRCSLSPCSGCASRRCLCPGETRPVNLYNYLYTHAQ